MSASSFLYGLMIAILISKVSSQKVANPTASPTANPTLTPTPQTKNPSSYPTDSPTIPSESPTAAPSAAPTVIPTIKETFCNLFNGQEISNIISTQQSAVISNIYIEDPLIISFDFIIGENECTTVHGTICNLIQFGATTEDIFFPRISTRNDNGKLYWKIQMSVGEETTENILYNLDQTGVNSESFAITANTKSNFHITFNGFQRQFYIGAKRFHYSEDNSSDFEAITNYSHPFYVSNPDQSSLNANITNLCISTASTTPTSDPTQNPSKAPTFAPTSPPTTTAITTTQYKKIDCYTEYGKAGERRLSCSKNDYTIVSCGIHRLNDVNTSHVIFYKGSYLERVSMNDLTSDGICYINYNTQNRELTKSIQPTARCCDFKQQYNDDFKCRYFKSEDRQLGTDQSASESSATKSKEFTYTTCPKEFPLLLSCTTRVDEDDKVTNVAETNNDIQFYGSFYASSGSAQFNPANNLFFELNTGSSNNFIPFAPTTSTTSTSQVFTPTKAPTNTPTSSADVLQLNISQTTKCVSQYGTTTSNYTVTAIATCCTESYSTSTPTIVQTTAGPTSPPTVQNPLSTAFFGTNGTNTGESFAEYYQDSELIGIDEWAIFQVKDSVPVLDTNGVPVNIWYQGILIGSYTIRSESGIETKQTSTDFHSAVESAFRNLEHKKPCSSFKLDTDLNGARDFITGFDVYSTQIAIFGLTFYTSFGRKYSCPDDEVFTDTSNPNSAGDAATYLDDKYYEMKKDSQRNVFGINGTYALNGWQGFFQTRTLQPAVVRSVMGSIGFFFTGQPFINTNSPSSAPTKAPPTKAITASPTFDGQDAIEELKCSTMWGVNKVSCKAAAVNIMTSCNGYSVEGQILNTFINDSTDSTDPECIVETVNNKTAAAIATCCYFYNTPPRNFNAFIYASVVGSCIFVLIFMFMWLYLCLVERHKTYFNPADVDDDTIIDAAIENVGDEVASHKVAQFRVDDDEHIEMLALQIGLTVGLDDGMGGHRALLDDI